MATKKKSTKTLKVTTPAKPAKASSKFTLALLETMGEGFMLPKQEKSDKGLQALADLLCSGLESGPYASFGVDTSGYVAPKPGDLFHTMEGELFRHIDYPMSVGGSACLFPRHEEGKEAEKRYVLDLPALKRGVAILALDHPHIYADWISDNDDAMTGDALVQCAVLGDIVYG